MDQSQAVLKLSPKIEPDLSLNKAFTSLVMDQLNTQDMYALLDSQHQIMKRLDETNKLLINTNQSSLETFNTYALKDFQSHINLLVRMKQDLDYVFKKIRYLKNKLQVKYPNEYSIVVKNIQEENKNLGLEDCEQDADEENLYLKNIQENLIKERSDSTASRLSASKSVFANFFETAKSRISPSLNRQVSGEPNQEQIQTIVEQNEPQKEEQNQNL